MAKQDSIPKFTEFMSRLEDAADYDNVATYLMLKRWARVHYGDNPPHYVVSTLSNIRSKFGPFDIQRLLAVPKTSARGLSNDKDKE